METKSRILIADDDAAILELVSDLLTDDGMDVTAVTSGGAVTALTEKETFDLIILDIMMRDMSGLDVCRAIRDKVSCPILFLSARDSIADKVSGLNIGADDYLTKPFALEELSARVAALLRRRSAAESLHSRNTQVIRIGEIELDPAALTVTKQGEPIALSTKEFELLRYLMEHAGQTLSKERIFRDVWNTRYGDIGTVAINIKNLRAKLDPDRRYIKTLWGAGYCFVSGSGYREETEE